MLQAPERHRAKGATFTMPATAFNHFNLRAPQPLLRRLRDFYVDVVGLREGWRPPFDFPGHWLYLGDQAVLHLVEDPPGARGAVPGASPTFDHVAFTCSGLAEMEARLQRLGVVYRRADVPGTTQCQLFVQDPAGNGVEFNFSAADR
jgi:glyoxylase I family protein